MNIDREELFVNCVVGIALLTVILAVFSMPLINGHSLMDDWQSNIASATAEMATRQTVMATDAAIMTATSYWANAKPKTEPSPTAVRSNESR